tara:strand:- start:5352 stop:5474 length:123 start_codon:yes stop_codon:yes gene_type:complete
VLDLFGQEYGWSMEDLEYLTTNEINYLIHRIKHRNTPRGR